MDATPGSIVPKGEQQTHDHIRNGGHFRGSSLELSCTCLLAKVCKEFLAGSRVRRERRRAAKGRRSIDWAILDYPGGRYTVRSRTGVFDAPCCWAVGLGRSCAARWRKQVGNCKNNPSKAVEHEASPRTGEASPFVLPAAILLITRRTSSDTTP